MGDVDVAPGNAARLRQGPAVQLENGARPAELLLLQCRPIGEPVVAQGPFVMNRRSEIDQITAVEVVDPLTVRLRLKAPFAPISESGYGRPGCRSVT